MDVKKLNIKFRSSLRGLKKCPSCGHMNGQRAALCRNEECPLRKKLLEERLRFEPVQLYTHGKPNTTMRLYSLRCKEREAQPRNFVEISETPLIFDYYEESTIVKRNAICYVDTCKYDATDAVGVICKHSKACLATSKIPQAEVYLVTREVIFNLNISAEQKQRLWDMYKNDEHYIPAVQALNGSVFAVKCVKSKLFPAGRLHVTALSNAMPTKKVPYACACKKLKIIVEPDNSVVMQDDVCDHILMVLAAVLSKQNGKTLYANFTNSLSDFWMPTALETPVLDASKDDAFLGMSINIGGSGVQNDSTTVDDIFIFGDEFLADNHIPDFSDIVLDITSGTAGPSFATQEPNNDLNFEISNIFDMPTTCSSSNTLLEEETSFEVKDCSIELMDQLELTDQIDMCTDDIVLPEESTELYDTNNISIVSAPLELNTYTASNDDDIPFSSTTLADDIVEANPVQVHENTFELPTIAVVNIQQCPPNPTITETQVQTVVQPVAQPISCWTADNEQERQDNEETDIETVPTIKYNDWLNYVIETINSSIQIVNETDIKHVFHVHEDMFAHLSKSFSIGAKRRVPNSTTIIKHGPLKGKSKFSWYFPLASVVKRIFTTPNLTIMMERNFERGIDGNFVPYIRPPPPCQDKKFKRIFPKINLYSAYICFDSQNNQNNNSFKINWIPDIYPTSNFGQLNIKFSLGIRDPHRNSSKKLSN